MLGESIRRPLAVALVAGVLGVAVVAAFLIGEIYERDTEEAGADSLRASFAMFGALERSDVKKMDAALVALLEDVALREAFLSRDRARLLDVALPRFRALSERDGITHWYFIDAARTVFLRVHKPELRGDLVERQTLRRAAETGNAGSGLELGQTAFALRVVRPWYVAGELIGYMELAEEIDHFLVRLKQETGNEFGLLVKKEYLDQSAWNRVVGPARNTWNARPDVVVVDTTTFSEGIIDFQGAVESLPASGQVLQEEVRGDRAWIRGVFPVQDAAGRTVGALAVLNDFTRMHAVMASGQRRVVLVVLAMSALASLIVWAALEWFVLRRLRALVASAEALQGGEPALDPGDELERLRRVVERLRPEPPRRTG
ncbi:MAG TPA: cache domain-containing protein [Anaeromyxobacteraceae bacterium]|nr:cache domain-containing protein [Anaeromyxobacteraceae bacterium]